MNFFSKTKPKAGKIEVFNSAEHLMDHRGKITTLEVKLDLRDQGYIAYQEDISHWMAELAEEHGWAYTCNGRFRVYQIAPAPQWVLDLLSVCAN